MAGEQPVPFVFQQIVNDDCRETSNPALLVEVLPRSGLYGYSDNFRSRAVLDPGRYLTHCTLDSAIFTFVGASEFGKSRDIADGLPLVDIPLSSWP
jgi:hypothetical protein